jgi:hypothetical protein
MDSDGKEVSLNHGDRKWLLADRPVVEVGARATVVLAMSTLTKVVTFKTPSSFKIVLRQMQKRKKTMLLIYILSHQVLTS